MKNVFAFGVLFVLAWLIPVTSYSQSPVRCYSYEYNEYLKTIYPQLSVQQAEFETVLQQKQAHYISRITTGTLITVKIPVVVHVVYNTPAQNISDAQIQSQIAILNQDFRRIFNTPGFSNDPVSSDTKIEFFLATTDPNGNITNGITRTFSAVESFTLNDAVKFTNDGGKDAWDNQKYLNIWVCNLWMNILGYAQFPEYPGTEGPYTPSTDGVVIHYGAFGNI